MTRLYRVESQAETLHGLPPRQVFKNLLKLKIPEEKARTLLFQQVTLKKGLNKARALELSQSYSEAGLAVKLVPYEIKTPAVPDTEPSPEPHIMGDLKALFASPIPKQKLTRQYKWAMLRAVLASLLAPLLYFGLIALTAGVIWWYFASGREAFAGDVQLRGYINVIWLFLTWVLPAAVGGIFLLFLLYPLWPTGNRPKPLLLDRTQYPHIYTLVEDMTSAIGVPMPKYIEIDSSMNAAAGPTHGLVSLMRGHLRLVIGLSLVKGLTVQQFIGVLAHEFGHFAQRNSMFANGWINSVNHWLQECADEDNYWREQLKSWQRDYEHEAMQAVLACSLIMIGLVQILFHRLYMLNLYVTQTLSQQMEFDADRYETRVTGSKAFRITSLRLRKLAYAHSKVSKENFYTLDTANLLLKDIPLATTEQALRFGKEMDQKIEQDLYAHTTEFWHSHPADHERIANAEDMNCPPMFESTLPACTLFPEFRTLCEKATLADYFSWGIHGAKEFITDNANTEQPLAKQLSEQPAEHNPNLNLNEDGLVEWPAK